MTIQRVDLASISLETNYGLTASATDRNTGHKFLRITDIRHGRIVWDQVPYCECNSEEAKKHDLAEGDVVFARTGSVGNSCLITNPPQGAVFASYLIRIRPDHHKVDPRFLAYFFQTTDYWRQIDSQAVGAIHQGLNASKLKQLTLPLPPLPEQQRVAGILSRADRLRRLRRYALKMSEGYLQSVFLEMFGDPATNPMGWTQAKIGDVVASSQYGTSAKSNSAKRGYPILGMGNITYTGEIDLTNVAWVDLTVEEFADLRLEPGDIVFNRTNSTELVGKTAQWAYSLDAVLASYLVKLRLSNQVLPSYFVALLNTRYFKLMFQARCLKAVGQSNISPTLLKEFPMLIPPLFMQRGYQEVVDKHKRLRRQQREALRQAEHLFQTLLHGAFLGEG